MQIELTVPSKGSPERQLREAALCFEGGALAGLKLVGIGIWRGADGEAYVTLPSFSVPGRQVLRGPAQELKERILAEFAGPGAAFPCADGEAVVELPPADPLGPDRQLARPEILWRGGALAGLRLVGFGIWRGADGVAYVTFPATARGHGVERRYFDFLRSSDGTAAPARALKTRILDEFRAAPERQAAQPSPQLAALAGPVGTSPELRR